MREKGAISTTVMRGWERQEAPFIQWRTISGMLMVTKVEGALCMWSLSPHLGDQCMQHLIWK